MDIVGTYRNNRYTAYFYDYKIVIETPRQKIKIRHPSYKTSCTELIILRELIESGRINRLDELRNFNGILIWENTSIPCLI